MMDYRTRYERFLMSRNAPVVCAGLSYAGAILSFISTFDYPLTGWLIAFTIGLAYQWLSSKVYAIRQARKLRYLRKVVCLVCGTRSGWNVFHHHRRSYWWTWECRRCGAEAYVGLTFNGIRMIYKTYPTILGD